MSQTLTLTVAQSMIETPIDKRPQNEEEENTREAELIVFDKTSEGLGLKICGGCSADGQEHYGIFIKRVLPHGLADLTGEVFDGDLILEVNGQSMQGVTYERAVSMLRQASASNHVELVITRDAESRHEFADYLTKYAPISSPYLNSDLSYLEAVIETGKEIKFESPLKDELSLDFDKNAIITDGNGHDSPTSSCTSEITNHMGEPLASSLFHSRPASNGAKDLMSDSLDSLLSKKLAQDPGLKLHIDQLESALTNLGLHLTPSSLNSLRQHLNIDITGMVRFEEFVEAAKIVFHQDLVSLKGRLTPQIHLDTFQKVPEDYGSVVKERDQLRAEIASIKEELDSRSQSNQNAEEQLLFIRKQAQASIEEVRSLKSKLHLAEQAQVKAQQTERDYEEVVAMLENEVAQLRMQMSKSDSTNMQKRLAVLVCQLKKAESSKKTYEVATEKLVRFVEQSLDTLLALDSASRSGADSSSLKLNKKKTLSSLSNQGREVIKIVRSLLETVPLPFGWEEAYTAEGVKYYINHLNQTTTWTHPVSCMEHQTASKLPALDQKSRKPEPAPALLAPPTHPQSTKHGETAKRTRQSNIKNVSPPTTSPANSAQAVS